MSKNFSSFENLNTLFTAIGNKLVSKYDANDDTESDLQDNDILPFYDTSDEEKKNTRWDNIKAKLQAFFDGIYRTKLIATFGGGGSSDAYCLLCTLVVQHAYINGPTEIVLQERGRNTVARLNIIFESGSTTDPQLLNFIVIGAQNNYYIVKTAASTWQIYVTKNEPYSRIDVIDYSIYSVNSVSITWNMTNAASVPSGAVQASMLTGVDGTKVAKAGDTMTGALTFNGVANAINFQGQAATHSMFRFKDANDAWGAGVIIGAGGLTVIGGGESADTYAADVGGSSEILALTNDGAVNVVTNLQNGKSEGKTSTFGTDGSLTTPGPVNRFYCGDANNAEHNANNAVKNGHYYYTSNGPTTAMGAKSTDGSLYVQQYNDNWVSQIAQDYRTGDIFARSKNNGTWTTWRNQSVAHIPRVAESCNSLPPTGETVRFREYTAGANYGLPTNAWYQILEIRSIDTKYGTQLALGMTVDAIYYRKYSGGSFGSWMLLSNAAAASAAQSTANSALSRANASIPFGGITTVTASSGTFNISANSTATVDVTIVVNDTRFKPVIAFYTSNNKTGRLIFAGKPVSIPDSNNKCSFQIANQSSSSYTGVVINVTALCVQKSN